MILCGEKKRIGKHRNTLSSTQINSHFKTLCSLFLYGEKCAYHNRHKENKGNEVPIEASSYHINALKIYDSMWRKKTHRKT